MGAPQLIGGSPPKAPFSSTYAEAPAVDPEHTWGRSLPFLQAPPVPSPRPNETGGRVDGAPGSLIPLWLPEHRSLCSLLSKGGPHRRGSPASEGPERASLRQTSPHPFWLCLRRQGGMPAVSTRGRSELPFFPPTSLLHLRRCGSLPKKAFLPQGWASPPPRPPHTLCRKSFLLRPPPRAIPAFGKVADPLKTTKLGGPRLSLLVLVSYTDWGGLLFFFSFLPQKALCSGSSVGRGAAFPSRELAGVATHLLKEREAKGMPI